MSEEMDVEINPICSYPPCTCRTSAGEEYCSNECKNATSIDDCTCWHKRCSAVKEQSLMEALVSGEPALLPA